VSRRVQQPRYGPLDVLACAGIEVAGDLKDRLVASNSATEGVHNLPFPAHLLHTGQLYIRPLPDLDEQIRLRSWLIVLGGLMAGSPLVTALPWYARGDYPALWRLFSDPTSCRRPTTRGFSALSK
jgi:hypothetical protein